MGGFAIDIGRDAPQQIVFSYLAGGARTPEWYVAVQTATKTTEGPTREGTRYTFTRVLPQGEVVKEVEVSEFDEASLVTFAAGAALLPSSTGTGSSQLGQGPE